MSRVSGACFNDCSASRMSARPFCVAPLSPAELFWAAAGRRLEANAPLRNKSRLVTISTSTVRSVRLLPDLYGDSMTVDARFEDHCGRGDRLGGRRLFCGGDAVGATGCGRRVQAAAAARTAHPVQSQS